MSMQVRCLICSEILECNANDTGNLVKHVRKRHPEVKLQSSSTQLICDDNLNPRDSLKITLSSKKTPYHMFAGSQKKRINYCCNANGKPANRKSCSENKCICTNEKLPANKISCLPINRRSCSPNKSRLSSLIKRKQSCEHIVKKPEPCPVPTAKIDCTKCLKKDKKAGNCNCSVNLLRDSIKSPERIYAYKTKHINEPICDRKSKNSEQSSNVNSQRSSSSILRDTSDTNLRYKESNIKLVRVSNTNLLNVSTNLEPQLSNKDCNKSITKPITKPTTKPTTVPTPTVPTDKDNTFFRRKYCVKNAFPFSKKGKEKLYKTSIEKWRPGRGRICCPSCGAIRRPLIKSHLEKSSTSPLGAACIVTCWPCCFLPCLFPPPAKEYLHCSNCNHFLGVYDRKNEIIEPPELQCPK